MPTDPTNDLLMRQAGRCAIITAFTPDFYFDFKIFLDSIRRITKIPIIAIPLGYSELEIMSGSLQILDVDIMRFTDAELRPFQEIGKQISKHDGEDDAVRWVQWHKPLLIKKTIERVGLDTILWLDADMVILDDLKPLFVQAVESFFVTNDYFTPDISSVLNDDRLYEEYPTPLVAKGKEDTMLNSGVIGFRWPRDQPIIDDWISKIEIITNNPHLAKYISLFDQGVLLWCMRDRDILHKILDRPTWNHKAVKNCYELNNVIDEVRFDNPNVTIAHFAGSPKLSQLCIPNTEQSNQFRANKYQDQPITRIFGVGLENAGAHALYEMFRLGSKSENWVRYNFEPSLYYESLSKWQRKTVSWWESYNTAIFKNRLNTYNRQDVQFVSEINHRLSFFVPEINEAVPNSKFVLTLRSPLALIRSRLLNFSCWSQELHKFAGCYQFDAYQANFDNNRLQPNTWDLSPIEMHVWEVTETLQIVLQDLRELPESNYKIIWIEDFAEACEPIEDLIPGIICWADSEKWENVERHSGQIDSNHSHSKETKQWVDEQIHNHANFIIDSITEILNKFGVPLHSPQY